MTNAMKKAGLAAVFGGLLLLGACGGNDDSPPPVTSEVPASASTSIGGFMSYLQALVAVMSDTIDPVDISAVTPPVDESSDPTVLQ